MTGLEFVFVFYMFANLMNLDNMMAERDAQLEELHVENYLQDESIDALNQDVAVLDRDVTETQMTVNQIRADMKAQVKE